MNGGAHPSEWSGRGVWRYRRDLVVDGDPVTLGEGGTVSYTHLTLPTKA